MVLIILAIVLGYLLGSFPTAYLLVRWKSRLDIRTVGSGSVGTLNSYLVTHSNLVGVGVLVMDVLKGVFAVVSAQYLFGTGFTIGAIAGCAAVVGHNFPLWLGWKGGRGLATAAGVMLLFCWACVLVWGVLWGIGFLLWRHVNVSNFFASFALLVSAGVLVPHDLLRALISVSIPVPDFRITCVVLMIIVLLRHIEPLKEFMRGQTRKRTTQ